MRRLRTITPVLLAACAACSSGGTGSETVEDQAQQNNPSNQPIFDIGTPSPAQLNGIYSFERSTSALFNAANASYLEVPTGNLAPRYRGNFQVGVNNSEEYLSGDINIRFDLTQNTGAGTVTGMSISGNEVDNRLLSNFETLDVSIPSVNGARFRGTITGTFQDRAQDPADGIIDYAVDTSVNGAFVEGGALDDMLGVVEGTITDPDRGTVPVFGVIVGEQSAFN